MSVEEYNKYDAIGLAGVIERGEGSVSEITEAAICQIERLNPALNAVITPMFDIARNAVDSGLPKGPLHGVPYLLKDLNTWFGGVRNSNGSHAFRNFIPERDSVLIERMKAAGLVIMGKTNTPEFLLHVLALKKINLLHGAIIEREDIKRNKK